MNRILRTSQPAPTVSIITPAKNADRTVRDCLSSVQSQTFLDWEHIVVDDASDDDTLTIIRSIGETDSRVRWIGLTNSRGAALARNVAIASARGRYIAFLDADDTWLPDKLSVQLEFMRSTYRAFTYGSYFVSKEGKPFSYSFSPPETIDYSQLLISCPIGCSTVMIDTVRIGGPAMPTVRQGQDWALWLALTRRFGPAYRFPGVHTRYLIQKGSLSSNKLKKMSSMFDVYRDLEGYGPLRSLWYLSRHSASVVFKRRKIERGLRPE